MYLYPLQQIAPFQQPLVSVADLLYPIISPKAYSYGGVSDMESEWAVSGAFLNDFFVVACDQDKWSAVTLKAGMEMKEAQTQREQVS